MTQARRTPRYVEAISPVPMGPQLMGPHEATAPAYGPHPLAHSPSHYHPRRSSSGVIPLHPPAAPATPPALPNTVRGVPLHERPWRVIVMPAAPSAAPRTFTVARWQRRLVLGILGLMLTLAVGFVAAIVIAVRTPELFPDLFVDGTEVRALRAELAATQDSLALARASASGDADDAEGPAVAEAPTPAIATPARPAAKKVADRPKPLSARGASDAGTSSLMPRSLDDLPVIGMLASGFSRARRHPLLRIVRPHLGVDVAAPRGTRVSAPAAGRVKFVGRKLGYGLVVEMDHGDGVTTRYAHLRSAAVQVGEQVTRGEAIAAVGTSGLSTGPHLHYEVLVNGKQVDPLRFRFAQNEPALAAPAVAVPTPTVTAPAVTPVPAPAAVGATMHESPAATSPSPAPR